MNHRLLLPLAALCALAARLDAQDFGWVKYAESELPSSPANIVADGAGHVYAAGSGYKEMRFDGARITNQTDGQAFLARYDERGARQWMLTTQCPYAEYITFLMLDTARTHLYVTGGRRYPTADRGPLFFAKYDTAGTLLWERTIDSEGGARTATMAMHPDGSIVAAGSTLHPTRVDGVTYPAGFFTMMMDTAGTVRWYRPAMKDSMQIAFVAMRVVMDGAKNSYVVGCIQSRPVVLDSAHTLYPGKRFRMFIIKYDADGRIEWARQNDGGEAFANAAAVERDGHVVVTGFFMDTTRFGGHTLVCGSGSNVFLVEYDGDGDAVSASAHGGGGLAEANDVEATPDGSRYVVGRAGKGARFGDITAAAAGAFFAKYNPQGACDFVVVARSASGQPDAHGDFVEIAANGTMYMAGQFEDGCTFDPFTLPVSPINNLFIARVSDPMPAAVHRVDEAPGDFSMLPNHPNPFSGSTTLRFRIPRAGRVTVEVCDMLGRSVRCLLSGAVDAGTHALPWDADALPRGAYVVRLRMGDRVSSRVMVKQ